MATLASSALTLGEWATRLDPGGKPAAVIELLGQTNEMLTDMLWMQCNDGAGHKTTIRTGLPAATWRLLNYGVQKSKSTTAQVRDATGMLESYSDIDKALADLNGNTAEFRMGEDMAFIEAMNQGQQQTIVYGSTAQNPERFTGLGPRFSSLTANNGVNIVDAGGSGSTTPSIWLVGWGQNTVHGLFPKGSKAGLQVPDSWDTLLDACRKLKKDGISDAPYNSAWGQKWPELSWSHFRSEEHTSELQSLV